MRRPLLSCRRRVSRKIELFLVDRVVEDTGNIDVFFRVVVVMTFGKCDLFHNLWSPQARRIVDIFKLQTI